MRRALLAAAGIGLLLASVGCSDDSGSATAQDSSVRSTAKATPSESASVTTTKSTTPGATECAYPSSRTASKPVEAPGSEVPPADAATLVNLTTSQGPIGLTLDPVKAPCTVNSFVSLVDQQYFDSTSCHRLTTADSLKVLQCGDPSGTGAGGPGYSFADEYPATDPALSSDSTLYKRGTLAMANAGPNTNGSQFFLVYADSQLPPAYTIFGTIDEAGLATLDKVAAAGVGASARGTDDGKPSLPVEITAAQTA